MLQDVSDSAWLSGTLPRLPQAPMSGGIATSLAEKPRPRPLLLVGHASLCLVSIGHTFALAVGMGWGRTWSIPLTSALVLEANRCGIRDL